MRTATGCVARGGNRLCRTNAVLGRSFVVDNLPGRGSNMIAAPHAQMLL